MLTMFHFSFLLKKSKMSHSRASITDKARQSAETSSSLAVSQAVVLVLAALLSCTSSSRLVSCRALQVCPLRSTEICTRDPKTGEKLLLIKTQPTALHVERSPLQGLLVNMFSTAVPFLFMWPDMTLSPLEKSGRSLNAKLRLYSPVQHPSSVKCAPSSRYRPRSDAGCSLSLPLAIPLGPHSAA